MKKLIGLAAFLLTLCYLMPIQAQQNEGSANRLKITTDGVEQTNTDLEDASTTTIEAKNNSAQVFTCSLNGLQRRVEIHLDSPPAPVPCQVKYYKDSETNGTVETLWSAYNNADYCGVQAHKFVTKLESMGWQCASN